MWEVVGEAVREAVGVAEGVGGGGLAVPVAVCGRLQEPEGVQEGDGVCDGEWLRVRLRVTEGLRDSVGAEHVGVGVSEVVVVGEQLGGLGVTDAVDSDAEREPVAEGEAVRGLGVPVQVGVSVVTVAVREAESVGDFEGLELGDAERLRVHEVVAVGCGDGESDSETLMDHVKERDGAEGLGDDVPENVDEGLSEGVYVAVGGRVKDCVGEGLGLGCVPEAEDVPVGERVCESEARVMVMVCVTDTLGPDGVRVRVRVGVVLAPGVGVRVGVGVEVCVTVGRALAVRVSDSEGVGRLRVRDGGMGVEHEPVAV